MKKIQNRLIAAIMAVVAAATIVTGGLGLIITRVSITTAVEENLTETAEVAALAAQNMIMTYTTCVGEIGRNARLGDPALPLDQKRAIIDDRVQAYYMRSGGLANLNGIDLLSGANVAQEPFYQNALQGTPYMSAPYIAGDDAYMVVSAPLYFQGAITGVVYFRCDTSLLQDIVEQVRVGESDASDAYVLDASGTTIAYVDEQSVLQQENVIAQAAADPSDKGLQQLAAIEQKMIAGETGFGRYTYSDGLHYLQAYAPIPGTDGWSLAVTVDQEEFLDASHIGQLVQTGVFIAVLALAFVMAMVGGRSIAAPIVQCTARLRDLAQGDLQSPGPQVNRKDEVQILADSTNELIADFRAIIDEVGSTLRRIAGGDLTCIEGQAHYPGDFAAIRENLQTICRQLNQTMGGITVAADQVAIGARQVATAGEALANGSTEQAAAVERLTEDIASLTEQIHGTAQGAQNANESSHAAQDLLSGGIDTMRELLDAMHEIERNADEIFKILKAIDDIAFQTNILSLNAAVEAARAGSAGKGFAVVADEVRNLASKSADSAKTSAELINRSVEATHKGAQLAEKTAAVLQHVMEGANAANGHIDAISAEAQRQAQAMSSINEHIEEISSVQHSVAATSEESASTAEELASQTDLMKEMVSRFRLDDRQQSYNIPQGGSQFEDSE